MTQMYGYARVSTREQNLDRQFDALTAFGVEPGRIFADKASGKDFARPEYRRLVRRMRQGDTLVVGSIDRLGRDYEEVLSQWRLLTKEMGCAVVVLDMPLLDTRSSPGDLTGLLISDIVLQLLSYAAQVERENIRARQAQGIQAARNRGVRFGRPCMERPEGYDEARVLPLRPHDSPPGVGFHRRVYQHLRQMGARRRLRPRQARPAFHATRGERARRSGFCPF